eukprot:3756798-Amphidinium_carterae.1
MGEWAPLRRPRMIFSPSFVVASFGAEVDVEVDVDDVDELVFAIEVDVKDPDRLELVDVDELALVGKNVVEVNVDLGVDVDEVDKLALVLVHVLHDVVAQSAQNVHNATTSWSEKSSTSAHKATQYTNIRDVERPWLVLVDVLEGESELELIEESVVVDDVDVEVDVEDVDNLELVLVVFEDVVERSMLSARGSTTSR